MRIFFNDALFIGSVFAVWHCYLCRPNAGYGFPRARFAFSHIFKFYLILQFAVSIGLDLGLFFQLKTIGSPVFDFFKNFPKQFRRYFFSVSSSLTAVIRGSYICIRSGKKQHTMLKWWKSGGEGILHSRDTAAGVFNSLLLPYRFFSKKGGVRTSAQ